MIRKGAPLPRRLRPPRLFLPEVLDCVGGESTDGNRRLSDGKAFLKESVRGKG